VKISLVRAGAAVGALRRLPLLKGHGSYEFSRRAYSCVSNPMLKRVLLCWLTLLSAAGASDDVLPATFATPSGQAKMHPTRPWTIPDLVEVSRITAIAIQGQSKAVCFIVKQPSIINGNDRYGIYLINADRREPARKLLEADYLSDLQWRPGSSVWTFRGDVGEGVQLYRIDASGRIGPVVTNLQTARVGGDDGLVASVSDGARAVGILAYGWSPGGTYLWYSRLRLRSSRERENFENGGVFYRDSRMYPPDFTGEPAAIAVELHLFTPDSGEDQIVGSAPGDRPAAQSTFQRQSTGWTDNQHISYSLIADLENGRRTSSRWIVDVTTGKVDEATTQDFIENLDGISTPEGRLVVRNEGSDRHLVSLSKTGVISRDFGPVKYTHIGNGLGYWLDQKTNRFLFGAYYPDHDGLTGLPGLSVGAPLQKIIDDLSSCDFTPDLSVAICSRESLHLAPELVAVSPITGKLSVLARPNARYDQVKPLRIVYSRWTNRFGNTNDGYITYPRDYKKGLKYPALVVTHGWDARNQFGSDGFQWEYPIQLFAERGYFVLSVNEPVRDVAASNAYTTGGTDVDVSRMQFAAGYNVIASMEAAVGALIDQGLVDSTQVGIAGYSEGGIITTLTISHSQLFRAGANGDTSFYSAGTYWDGAMVRALYKGLFGGSPFDPKVYENYRAFSPSARAEHFAGPLLQQFTAVSAPYGVELDQLLEDAHVPHELVFYRDETHLLHNPRRRASAMQLNLDWFDYWLIGRRDPDPKETEQYRRWDRMAAQWRASSARRTN
jgi:dipeptidyl aminopeptidase/acylaminoacyl peptidase